MVADGHRRSLMVGVGNGRGIGGGTAAAADAPRPTTGCSTSSSRYATGPFARVRYGAALAAGHAPARPRRALGARPTVTVSGEPVGVNADGELGDEATAPHVDGRAGRLVAGAGS